MFTNILYILLYEKTVKKLTDDEKNKYHEENSFAAELVLVKRNLMPKTHNDLKEWVIENLKKTTTLSRLMQWMSII